jgi:hypothetical protein
MIGWVLIKKPQQRLVGVFENEKNKIKASQ